MQNRQERIHISFTNRFNVVVIIAVYYTLLINNGYR